MSRTPKGGRRRLDSSAPPDYDVPTREPRLGSVTGRFVMVVVFLAWVAGTAAAGTSVVAVDEAPSWIQRPAAALLMVVFAIGLTHRGGGHMRIWLPLTVLLGGAAVAMETNVLLTSAAAVTAVAAAVWAVLMTRPARSIFGAFREYVLSLVVALSGTVAVAAWNAPVNYQRFSLIVLCVSLIMAITLVWNLGAGLHGLSRHHLATILGVAAAVILVLAYSSFVRTHGSQWLVRLLNDVVIWTRQTFNGVPRPVEVLALPALVVGVSLRSKRREGWWIQVFAVVGTAALTTSLVTPGAFPTYIGLSSLYSGILGLIIGLIARRYVLKERSSRASRAIEPVVRVEPPRFAPLK
jgi:hypothetical protein